ncbi:hypothetical protein [Glaciecola petra]|uniref:Solute-binding protein family 3/N-terminal domain-containing protein n=1 Tax=Glaciecola petra TaxID=3075602 RepID=A0ABU2ZQU1_9ALTE|nr:hypothetical protein [Aestuariibacter sp. P117]MDT0595006.1 hypothetical protein [Aestuariibacter sp. P117]
MRRSVSPLFLIVVAFCMSSFITQSDAKNNASVHIHYEDIYFSQAYKNKDPKNAVSAAMLLVVDNLPNDFTLEFLPTARSIIKFSEDTDDAICALFKLKSAERASRYYFSLPIGLMQTHRLYLREEMGPLDPSLLNEEGAVKNIEALFEVYPDTQLMLWENISQGDHIDAALKNIAQKNKVSIQGMTSYLNLALLITRSRADFAILPPAELNHYENNTESLNLLSYRIAGIEPVSKVHMMCNKTKASAVFLKTANSVIRDLYQTPEYLAAGLIDVAEEDISFVIKTIEDLKEQVK